ncbi:hypothetical protein SDC9_210895 [bioreactor metagenome]|uniref:Uncharacterized protein n=1 Tax=bioreactor metagenome TaxID=1076179 RepID=A0A645JHP6_9ZZZZ
MEGLVCRLKHDHFLHLRVEMPVNAGQDSQIDVARSLRVQHLGLLVKELCHAFVLVGKVAALGALGAFADINVLGTVKREPVVIGYRGLGGIDEAAPAASFQLAHGFAVVVFPADQKDHFIAIKHA